MCKTSEENYGFSVPDEILDLNNYTTEEKKNIFLGSIGRRVGAIYAGTDDILIIEPKFDTGH